jgi:ADP-ribose pyrophosphatase
MSEPETLFETRWIRMHRIGHWDYVVRPHSANCVGILAVTPENEILLVEQFRIPVGKPVVEIPAGIVGDEPEFLGESLADTAARELLEETGYRAGRMEKLISTPTSAGLTSEMIHLYQAHGLVREHAGGGTGSENITVHRVPLAELRGWLRTKEETGVVIDFKIHAVLCLARIPFA